MTSEIQSALRAQLQRVIELVSLPAHDDQNPTRTLLARLNALAAETAGEGTPERLQIGRLAIDLAGREVSSAGRNVHLTHREFALLAFLAQRAGRACTRHEIIASVWGDRTLASSRTVDIHVYRLRTKLGEPFAELIQTLRHVGYKLLQTPLTAQLEPASLLPLHGYEGVSERVASA